VLVNALRGTHPDLAAALRQTTAIERILQHHLARARSSALTGRDSLVSRASPLGVAEEVAAALRRLQAERSLTITVSGDAALRVRVDRQDLIEIVGNLMENACKWATSRVEVCIMPPADQEDGRRAGGSLTPMLAVVVDDDGPGLLEDQSTAETIAVAVARGVRLDETVPGAGLGLAIVADLANLHAGRLTLGRSSRLSGAAVRLELPAAAAVSHPPANQGRAESQSRTSRFRGDVATPSPLAGDDRARERVGIEECHMHKDPTESGTRGLHKEP
jgi:signal transduction histidine kinase